MLRTTDLTLLRLARRGARLAKGMIGQALPRARKQELPSAGEVWRERSLQTSPFPQVMEHLADQVEEAVYFSSPSGGYSEVIEANTLRNDLGPDHKVRP